MAWQCEDVVYRYPAMTAPALDGVSIDIPDAGFTAVIGPNGSGKTTLLRLLLGRVQPSQGEIRFRGRAVGSWSREELAREVGVVPQGEEAVFPMTTWELVAMGRYPYLGLWRPETDADRRAIQASMTRCDVLQFASRLVSTLSGGERQRARVARALTQEPGALALDEPTVALDLHHEMEIFELLRTLSRGGVSVLLVSHNLNLAIRFANQVVVLDHGRVAAMGPPADVVTEELVRRVFGWPVRVVGLPGPGRDAGVPQVVPLSMNDET